MWRIKNWGYFIAEFGAKIFGVANNFLGNIYFKSAGVNFKFLSVRMDKIPILKFRKEGEIIIGRNVTFTSKSSNNPAGISHPVSLALLKPNAKIVLGDNVGISGASICAATSITIENNVLLGAGVKIWDTDFHPIQLNERIKDLNNGKSIPVIIRKNVFIGANAIIMKGVEIGEQSVIGAGSVVSKSVPANEIWAGNPAKKIQ